MAWTPCYFCGNRFIGPAVTAYHRWSVGDVDVGYRQKACPSCASVAWECLLPFCIPTEGEGAVWPENCKACGTSMGSDFSPSYHSFFRKKVRQDLIAAVCETCAIKIRPALLVGDDSLTNRSATSQVIDGGAVTDDHDLLTSLGYRP